MKSKIDLVIPSYQARHLLEKHLPAIYKHSPNLNQVIIVEDGGSDDTPQFLEENYPDIKLLINKQNKGFSKSVNRAVSKSNADFIVLLNNDVEPYKDYLENAFKYFEDDKVFAVNFHEKQSSWPKVSWKNGKLQYTQGEDKKNPRLCAWPSGGSTVLRMSIWRELGGFNEIYSPGYWEDIDLGWRAWKAGYQTIWAPDAYVDHQHESSFKKLDQNYLNLIKQRNELFFHWQNITDRKLALDHFKFLISHTINHPGYSKVIFAAFKQYSKVARNRVKNRRAAKLTDKQVLKLVNSKI